MTVEMITEWRTARLSNPPASVGYIYGLRRTRTPVMAGNSEHGQCQRPSQGPDHRFLPGVLE